MDHQNDNQPYTPYAPPAADIGFGSVEEEMNFIPGGRSVPVGSAFAWISDSWGLFKRQSGTWIGFILTLLGMHIIAGFVPVIGDIAMAFIQVLLIAGVIHSCGLLRREGSFRFGDLFIGFQRKTGPLMILVLITFGFLIGVLLIAIIFLGISIGGSSALLQSSIDPAALLATGGVGIIGIFIVIIGVSIYAMAAWFAPALVIMHDIAPFQALKMSFSACLKNILPGIIFFIVMSVLMAVSVIPLGLGLLITMPMLFICYYTSYCSIFLISEEN